MANSFIGELLHFVAVRYRVTGSGSLRTTLQSLDEVNAQTLPIMTMASTTAKELSILANFRSQRAKVRIETTAIDETFNVSKIVVFTKPTAAGFPM